MYKLCFFIPESHIEQVKTALFNEGAGRTNQYDQWCWQVLGEGQFRPLENSHPFLGARNKLEKVAEYKVEMVCADNVIVNVVKELIEVHPYQQPAYEIVRIMTVDDI